MADKGNYSSPFGATLKGITDLFRKKENVVQLPESIDLSGKNVMIVGASAGLGLATAKRVARAGANLIMAVRSGIPEKGEEVKQESGNINVTMRYVDLLDFNSIDRFIAELVKDDIRIDILISNAAMVPLKARKTPQGQEEMFMVNYLSAFYLINSLVAKDVIDPAHGRIIITSSESHRNPKDFDWDKFGVYEEYGINETVSRYGYFKLLLTTFANELSRQLNESGKNIAVRSLCPGPVNSNIAREAPGWMQPLLKATFSIFFRSPEKASDPLMYFIAEKNPDTASVNYLFLMQRKAMDEKSVSEGNGKKLWSRSNQLLNELGYEIKAER